MAIKVKIDTKEKFRVMQPDEARLDAIMAGELAALLLSRQSGGPTSVIADLCNVEETDAAAAQVLLSVHDTLYAGNASFVITRLQASVAAVLRQQDKDHRLNIAPRLEEAIDMVMMEELERELFMEDDQS